MSRIKKVIFILFFAGTTFICLLLGAGCWGLREPQAQAIVLALAVDRDEESGLFEVVVEVGVPSALVGTGGGGDGGGGGGQQPAEVVSAKGQTVFEALRRLETRMPRQLYWGHNSLVIFSEKLARQGLFDVLDFFERERYSRLITRPLVAMSDIKKLVQVRFPLEGTAGEGYVSQLTTLEASNTLIPPGDLGPVMTKLSQPGIEIFLPSVRLVEEESSGPGGKETGGSGGAGKGDAGGESGMGEQPARVVETAGGAAFIGDRMVGWLGVEATQGWLWITGNIRRITQVIPCPMCSQVISIDIIEYSSSLEVFVRDGRPRVKVKVSIDGRVQDLGCRHTLAGGRETAVSDLNKGLEDSIRKLMQQAVEETKELGSDIFGFGREFYRRKPREWRKMKDDWERIFREELAVEFEIKANVRRLGLILDPIHIR